MDKDKKEDIFPDEIFDLELLKDPNCNDEQNVLVECLEDLLSEFEGKGIICTPGRWREDLSDRIHQKYGDVLLPTNHEEGLDVQFMSRSEPEGDSLVSVDMYWGGAKGGTITYNPAIFALPASDPNPIGCDVDPIECAFPDKLVLLEGEGSSKWYADSWIGGLVDVTVSDSCVLVRPKKALENERKLESLTVTLPDVKRAWEQNKGRIARLLEPQLVDKTDRSKIKQILHAAVELVQIFVCEQYLSANNVMPSVCPWKADWNGAFNVISRYQMSVKDMLDFFWDSVNGDLQYTLRGDWVEGGWITFCPAAVICREGYHDILQKSKTDSIRICLNNAI